MPKTAFVKASKQSFFRVRKRAGRPSTYTPEIAARICALTAEGCSLIRIGRLLNLHVATICNWLIINDDFQHEYARARDAQADVMDAMILDTALNSTPETANADRVKILAFQWRAGRLAARRYGDQTTINQRIEHVEDPAEVARKNAQAQRLIDVLTDLADRKARGESIPKLLDLEARSLPGKPLKKQEDEF